MKTRIVHIAVVMTLAIGIFCLNTPKADAANIRWIWKLANRIKLGLGTIHSPHPLPPPPIQPPLGGIVRPPIATGPPPPNPPVAPPPNPPVATQPKPTRPPMPRPNPGVNATRTGRSLLGRVARGDYLRKGGKFFAKGLKFYGPIAVISLAADGGHLLADGLNAMERDADRAMAKDMARFEDRYRNPGKYGGGGRFDSSGGYAQSLYNATRPY